MVRGIPRAAAALPVRSLALALLVLSVTFAGCVDDEPSPTTADDGAGSANADAAGQADEDDSADPGEPAEPSEPQQVNETEPGQAQPVFVSRRGVEIAWAGCREYRSTVPTTAAAFADDLPDGFSIVASDPAGLTTDIVMWIRYCPSATFVNAAPTTGDEPDHYGEMWTAVPVTSPDGLVPGAADVEYWPITWTVDSARVLDNYFAWGMSSFARAGTVELLPDQETPALITDGVLVEHSAGRYRWTLALALTGSGMEPDTTRVWVPGDASTPGAIMIERVNGTGAGEGSGYMRQSGDDSLLTLMPLNTAFVEDVDVTTRFQAVE